MFFPLGEILSFTHTKTTGKITVLYILMFKFLDMGWENKRF